MLNYLHSEIFRTVRLRGLHVFLLFCLGSLGLFAVLSHSTPDYQSVSEYLGSVSIGAILGAIAFPAVFSALNRKEKGIHVQMISFGMKREIVFISDFIILCLSIFVVGLLLVVAAIAVALLLYGTVHLR